MNELKPCPFCGGKAEMFMVTREQAKQNHFEKWPEKIMDWDIWPESWWVLGCATEECILNVEKLENGIKMKLMFYFTSEEQAINAWNRRKTNDE